MRKSQFSPQQIAKVLKEFDDGKSVSDITRDHGVGENLQVFKEMSGVKECKNLCF